MQKIAFYSAAITACGVIGYCIRRYVMHIKALYIQKAAKKKPLLLDNDTASIVASFLVEKPYKVREEIAPYKQHINLVLVRHSAITQFIDEQQIEEFIKDYKSYHPDIINAMLCNPYLANIIRDMTKSNNAVLLDIISYLCTSKNPDIMLFLDRHSSRLSMIDWRELSTNPAAIKLLEKNLNKISWFNLAYNKAAGDLIEAHYNSIDSNIISSDVWWSIISYNQSNLSLLRAHLDKLNWNELSANPGAIPILRENVDKINWEYLSAMPEAIDIIRANVDKINWYKISSNPAAIDIIAANQHRINFQNLCKNPAAIDIIRANIDNPAIDWARLSINKGAIPILRENTDKIDWYRLMRLNKAVSTDLILTNIDKAYTHINVLLIVNNNPAQIADLIFEVDMPLYKKMIKAATAMVTKTNINKL